MEDKIYDVYHSKYTHYTEEDYIRELKEGKIRFIENMSGKEPLNDEYLENLYKGVSEGTHYIEEKLDGTRADMQFNGEYARLFSRRISKKTNWYSENTHNFPWLVNAELHNRIDWSDLEGTVIDGELTSSDNLFKTVSSLCNCKWDEAVNRQLTNNIRVYYNAFDIMYYHGVNVMGLPLYKRKELLKDVLSQANNEFIRLHPFYNSDIFINGGTIKPKEWYEHIVEQGGEGVMIKPINAPYTMKKGRDYTKVKKFITRDVIIMGYTEPTRAYEGKDIDKWGFFIRKTDGMQMQGNFAHNLDLYEPVTKAYYYQQIGTIRYGVVITDEELEEWYKRNPKEKPFIMHEKGKNILEVGECSGLTDEQREYYTENQRVNLLNVIEVGCNEIITKTGKLRHPRYRFPRHDKSWDMCTWVNHIEG